MHRDAGSVDVEVDFLPALTGEGHLDAMKAVEVVVLSLPYITTFFMIWPFIFENTSLVHN